jgi:hypothetical protein
MSTASYWAHWNLLRRARWSTHQLMRRYAVVLPPRRATRGIPPPRVVRPAGKA